MLVDSPSKPANWVKGRRSVAVDGDAQRLLVL